MTGEILIWKKNDAHVIIREEANYTNEGCKGMQSGPPLIVCG